MTAAGVFRNQAGRPVPVGDLLGRGGEGAVHAVTSVAGLAAKIYNTEAMAADRREKILAMVEAGWHAKARHAAFPVDALSDASGRFVGFTMRKVNGHKPIHELYSPTSRKVEFPKADFAFLLRTAVNFASTLAGIHATGCVVGDVNHSGVMVAQDATVTLIDCDSFQVKAAGKTFLCKVGVPDTTPPELRGKKLDRTPRTPNHDNFGLGVIVFQLLFLGRHPFDGRYSGPEEMDMEKAIAEFRFAYSARASETGMRPPPGVPTLDDVPPSIAEAFERCFSRAGAKGRRPTAAEWARILAEAEKDVVQCAADVGHRHFGHARSCPWCRMEATYIGFSAFVAPLYADRARRDKTAKLIAAVRSVPDPGPTPELHDAMVKRRIGRLAAFARYAGIGRFLVGLAVTATAAHFLRRSAPELPWLLAGTLAGALLAVVTSRARRGRILSERGERLAGEWAKIETEWIEATHHQDFLDAMEKAGDAVRRLQNLPQEETRLLGELGGSRRNVQSRQFLEKFRLRNASIAGTTEADKTRLASCGIETAADVTEAALAKIPAMSGADAAALLEWKRSIEAKFVFDPNLPVGPEEIAGVRSEVSRTSTALEAELRGRLGELRRLSGAAEEARRTLLAKAAKTWRAMDGVWIEYRILHAWGWRRRLAAFALLATCAVVAGRFAFPLPDPLQAAYAAQEDAVARRLADLGYSASTALRDFKASNGLPADDVVDAATAARLNSASAVPASASFLGTWSPGPECAGGSRLELDWAGVRSVDGACRFTDYSLRSGVWKLDATCRFADKTTPRLFSMAVRSGKLVLRTPTGDVTYFRCRP